MKTNKYNNKHLSLDDRLEIEKGLKNNLNFREISEIIHKDPTTISKEIRNHYKTDNKGAKGRPFLDCKYRNNCEFKVKGTKCNSKICEHYKVEKCSKLERPPYVCNGCNKRCSCTLTKKIYDSTYAFKEYSDTLKECRQGITYNEKELNQFNNILKPLIVDKKQSLHSAFINNKNQLMISERELYRLIDLSVLNIRNIDLPRKVRYRIRPKNHTKYKVDKKCLENRRYSDFKNFICENPDINIVEMDTVEGLKGGKVLLTLHFVNCSFMLAFLRDCNNAQSVIDIFNQIQANIGIEKFKKLFQIILTDNGSEFSNPSEIEIDNQTGEVRTKIFYCDPGRPDQKGSCEVNHEFIRRILPKGNSFDNLTQEEVNKIMSNINSYKRKKLNDCSPLQLFSLLYGDELALKFGIKEIDSNDIDLSIHK